MLEPPTLDGRDLLVKIAEMPEPDRGMAERIHAIVTADAPDLMHPKTWYGIPAYARDGKVVCFFKAREVQLPVRDVRLRGRGPLDDGAMWPTFYALKELTAAGEAKIAALVKKAAS